jgi:hypothetical protein
VSASQLGGKALLLQQGDKQAHQRMMMIMRMMKTEMKVRIKLEGKIMHLIS